MNHQGDDSSSDDIPYLPPDQYHNYENHQSFHQSQNPEQRRGRSHFTEDELQELDSIPLDNDDIVPSATVSSIPRPISEPDVIRAAHLPSSAPPPPYNSSQSQQRRQRPSLDSSHHDGESQSHKISWGRRTIGILLITIPAVLFSAAAHFVDWSMSDFQLSSSSFFIFQGIFWPCLGLLLMDLFCMPRKHVPKNRESVRAPQNEKSIQENKDERTPKENWMLILWTFIHSNLTATILILQILSIQRLNISISLALSFGFDVVLYLVRYILETKRFSWELVILTIISYCGYGVAAIPAFTASDRNTRYDTAAGVGASIGVMLLSVPASFILTHLRRHQVRESVLGTSFAFVGCIQALITHQIMGSTFDLVMDGQSAGWVAGLISVVFLGTIFFHLEARLSGLIWERDEDDRPKEFSSITRTRIAIFILSCLWELARQGFRETIPVVYDIVGGFLVMLSFLLAGGYQAWHRSNQQNQNQIGLDTVDRGGKSTEMENKAKFCAFIPWLFSQKHSRISHLP